MFSVRPSVVVGVMSLALACSAAPALARVVPAAETPAKINFSDITSAVYGVRKIYLAGKWTVVASGSGVTFTKGNSTVTLQTVPKDGCGFQVIRTAALKAWGGKQLDQSKSRIETLTPGRSVYRGFSWILPNGRSKEYHWCLIEDRKNATEVVANDIARDTLDFIKTSLVRQLAVRSAIR